MRQGIIGGSVAAIVAALVSLPLHSPNDAFFNTASVVLGSLLTGLAAGGLWRVLTDRTNPRHRFVVIWTAAFAISAVFLVAANTQIDRMMSFGVPLTAIVFSLTGATTTAAADIRLMRSWWAASIGVVAALAIGFALAGQGDQESGRLELPPRTSSLAVPAISDQYQEVLWKL